MGKALASAVLNGASESRASHKITLAILGIAPDPSWVPVPIFDIQFCVQPVGETAKTRARHCRHIGWCEQRWVASGSDLIDPSTDGGRRGKRIDDMGGQNVHLNRAIRRTGQWLERNTVLGERGNSS